MKHGKRKWITQGKKKVGKKERKKRWKGKIKNKWIYEKVKGGKRSEKDEKIGLKENETKEWETQEKRKRGGQITGNAMEEENKQ